MLVLFASFACVNAVITSSSTVVHCDRLSAEGQLCTVKLVIRSSLDSGSLVGDEIHITETERGAVANPIKVSVKKSATVLRHSVKYLGSVNSKPVEKVIVKSLLSCRSAESTCGRMVANKIPIPDSEGFCCSCSIDQLFGLVEPPRGQAACGPLSALHAGSSAHCLRWDPVWYAIFSIGPPTYQFEISISSENNKTYKLNPASPITKISEGDLEVTVRILGDLSMTRPGNSWSDHYAARVVPQHSKNWEDSRIKLYNRLDPFKDGLLLPRDAVDLSGRTCNKIGVSHSAFVQQSNRCGGKIGFCLENQISDFINFNRSGIADKFCQNTGTWIADGESLNCLLDGDRHVTDILIELDAKNMVILIGDPKGQITQAIASKESAMSQLTRIGLEIQNTDDRADGDYLISAECSDGIYLASSALAVSVPSGGRGKFVLRLEVKNSEQSTYTCTLELRGSSKGDLHHSMSVPVEIGPMDIDKWAQNGEGGKHVNGNGQDAVSACDVECTSFFEILCFLSNFCIAKITKLIASGIGTLVAGYLLFNHFGSLLTCAQGLLCLKPRKSVKEYHYRHSYTPKHRGRTTDWPYSY